MQTNATSLWRPCQSQTHRSLKSCAINGFMWILVRFTIYLQCFAGDHSIEIGTISEAVLCESNANDYGGVHQLSKFIGYLVHCSCYNKHLFAIYHEKYIYAYVFVSTENPIQFLNINIANRSIGNACIFHRIANILFILMVPNGARVYHAKISKPFADEISVSQQCIMLVNGKIIFGKVLRCVSPCPGIIFTEYFVNSSNQLTSRAENNSE